MAKIELIRQESATFGAQSNVNGYLIEGQLSYSHGRLISMPNGEVKVDGHTVATFSAYGQSSKSINFQRSLSGEEELAVLSAINEYGSSAAELEDFTVIGLIDGLAE